MQKKAAAKSWEYCQHADAAALVTSNLLIPAAMNVPFPQDAKPGPERATVVR